MTHIAFGASLIFVPGDLDEAIYTELATAGLETFEISASKLSQVKQRQTFKQLASRQGPKASSLHAQFGAEYDLSRLEIDRWQFAVNRAVETVEVATELDIPIIVFHASFEPVLPDERSRRIDQALKGLSLIGQKARLRGRRIAIEYLPRSCLGNNLAELNLLIDRLGDETFGVCLDVNHLMAQHAELPQIVQLLGARLIATHLSDYDGVDEKHWLPGKGVLNWPGFMHTLREIDYKGPFTYECNLEGDSLADKLAKLRENYTWLSSI